MSVKNLVSNWVPSLSHSVAQRALRKVHQSEIGLALRLDDLMVSLLEMTSDVGLVHYLVEVLARGFRLTGHLDESKVPRREHDLG